MADEIIPASRSLFLCDFHVGYQDGRVDLYGIFNALRPAIYPHVRRQVVVYAHLTGGLGHVPFFFDVRRASNDELIRTTGVRSVHFPDRGANVQLAMTLEGVRFTEPGVYVFSLFCHNTWVCDTTVTLH